MLFANSLGTDLRVRDKAAALLPPSLRLIRYDKRGHGLSALGGGASIADHTEDAVTVIGACARGPVIFVGLSIGGLIAQRVASLRPDLVSALVLPNTAASLGRPDRRRAGGRT